MAGAGAAAVIWVKSASSRARTGANGSPAPDSHPGPLQFDERRVYWCEMRSSGSLILVGLVVVLAGCGNATPSLSQSVATSTATPAPSAVQSASLAPTDAPTDTPEPSSGLVTIPTDSLKSMPEGAALVYGSRVFSVANGRPTDRATVTMRSFAGPAPTIPVRTIAGHPISEIAATAERLIWVETWRQHPSPPSNAVPGCVDVGKPLYWRVMALVIASGAQSVVASGINLRTAFGGVCNDIDPPVIAASSDRVAYTLEAGSQAHPFANRIVVRSLATGIQIRSIVTNGIVQGLDLVDQVLLYRDDGGTPASLPFADPFDGRLELVMSDQVPAIVVVDHVSIAGLGDGRIAWVNAAPTDGSVWTESLASGEKRQLAVSDSSDFHPDSTSGIAVSKDVVAWIVQGEGSDSVGTSRLALWTAGGIGPGILDQFGQAEFVGINAGWLVWDVSTNVPEGQPAGVYGMPESALLP